MKNDLLKRMTAIGMTVMMLFSLTGVLPPASAVYADEVPVIKVLEVQPGTTYELPSILTSAKGYSVETITMKRFIADKRQLNGLYDIVYIGNAGGGYTAIGPRYTSAKNGLGLEGTLNSEYFSANDITSLKSADVQEFINSGQMMVFASSVFNDTATNIYKQFNGLKNGANVKLVSGALTETELKAFYDSASVIKKPSIKVTASPAIYNPAGANGGYNTGKYMEFTADVAGTNRMNLNLYVDSNGDSVFSVNEKVRSLPNIPTGELYAINFSVPTDFVGLQPWKLEAEDIITHAKSYQTGATAFKAETARAIKVLQITPDGTSFSISGLGASMLKTPVYDITVVEKRISEINSNPALMDDNYDMIIIGFADSYNSKDFNATALNKLQAFIDADRSVMFTHDTMAFWVNRSLMTQKFRNTVGQDIYPNDSKYGWNDPTLTRTLNGSMPTYTKAYKVNDGLINQYPYPLGDLNSVSNTHAQYFQLNLEDPEIVSYYSLIANDPRNEFYMYSKGNITYSGTGHASPGSSAEEKKLFVNTMVKAIRGANNAPIVDVQDIVDNQNIITSVTSLAFRFAVSDIDEAKDAPVTAKIYVDANNDGSFESARTQTLNVKNLEFTSATIDLTGVGSRFKIRVEGFDPQGASSYKDIVLTHDNIPGVNLSVSKEDGYLVGDTDTLNYTLSAQATTLNKSYTSLKLETTATPLTGIPFKPTGSWTALDVGKTTAALDSLVFSPTASWTGDKVLSLPVSFTQAGEYTVKNSLSYTDGSTTKSFVPAGAGSYTLKVKEGRIGVDVKNNMKAVKNTVVRITDSNGNPVSYTNDAGELVTDGRAVTGNTGHVTFGKLPSGTYKIVVDKTGYAVKTAGYTDPATITLNYDTPTVDLEYGPSTELITTPVLSDSSGHTSLTTVTRNIINLKFTFNLLRDTSTIKLLFNSDGLTGTYTNIKLGSTVLTLGPDGYITLPENLNSGSYILTMTVIPAAGTEQTEPRALSFPSYMALERDVEGATEMSQAMPTNLFNLKITQKPKIE